MENVKLEFLEHIKGRKVTYVHIKSEDEMGKLSDQIQGTYEKVIDQLDFDYDNEHKIGGSWSKRIYGYIWYDDGSWSERNTKNQDNNYVKSYWVYRKCPLLNEYFPPFE